MIGGRGCGRCADPFFEGCFATEPEAIEKVRGGTGTENVEVLNPFVRTLDMAKDVNAVLAKRCWRRGEDGLKVLVAAGLPSNVFLADVFVDYYDGLSIGSNDLTQLTLGLDCDSGLVTLQFGGRDFAVVKGLEVLIKAAKANGEYVGSCGQGFWPS